ncbi:MAG TPA: PEPxxWA-CTERM sorting domain-containing protein [Phenylobacterium sp.]|jgi:hypothetical protein|nr:PEPxxWA-CTERM sorting domain-containing protein [Phenylobacterium sp.]
MSRSFVLPRHLARGLAATGAALGVSVCLAIAAPARADVEVLNIPLNTFDSVTQTVDLTTAFNTPRSNYEITITADSPPLFTTLDQSSVSGGTEQIGNNVYFITDETIYHEDQNPGVFDLLLLGDDIQGQSNPQPQVSLGSSPTVIQQFPCPFQGIVCSNVTQVTNVGIGVWGPTSLTYVLTPAEVAQVNAAGGFSFTIDNPSGAHDQQELLNMQITSLPEPTAWALMILGFGGAGAQLRRRRTLAGVGG